MASHDTAWKMLFSFPEMVRDLLAGFVPPEWVSDLDLCALTRHSESQVTDDARERHPDRVWEVGMRDRSGSVLVTFEFQSTVDRTMAVRVLVYTAMLYQDRLRRSSALLPPVLPIVVYYGPGGWTAEEAVSGLCAAPGTFRAPYLPAQGHFLLDVGRYTAPLPDGRNWMAALVRLARTPDPEVAAAALCDMSAWWPESNYDSLLDAILSWLGQVHFPMHGIKLEIPKLANVREAVAMLHQVGIDWSAKLRAEGRTEGRTEGRAEGQIAVMRRQADRKFGPEIAERLAGYLAEISDPERLGEVGEWILECDEGEELLAPGGAAVRGGRGGGLRHAEVRATRRVPSGVRPPAVRATSRLALCGESPC